MASIGSTISHSTLKLTHVKKGQPGLQRAMENPFRINLKGCPESEKLSGLQNLIMAEMIEVFPEILDNIKPDDPEFKVFVFISRL